MRAKYHYSLIILLLCTSFGFSLYRDIRVERQYVVDLRNRVVGARLQMDGKAPYFYRWYPRAGVRYYDPVKFDTSYASAITASPFLHHLLFPIANLPQRQISRIWLGLEYALWMICILLAFCLTKTRSQQWAVAMTAALFLFTDGWVVHVLTGEVYLFFACLGLVFVFCMLRAPRTPYLLLAGTTCAALILSRPNVLLCFVPFVFLVRKASFKSLILFLSPVILLFGYSLLNARERGFWQQYSRAIGAHIQYHQSENFGKSGDRPYYYKQWEGWDVDSIRKARTDDPITLSIETSSAWVFVLKVFHVRVPVLVQNLFSLLVITLLLIVFFARHGKGPAPSIPVLALFGFCLYMISDFLSPISRIQYYAVQWIFPLLLAAVYFSRPLRIFFFFLLLGVLLNIINTPFLKMRHTIGELIILFSFLWLCLSRQSKLLR